MGRVSEWMLEQQERGYSEADGDICTNCVSDPALKAWVAENLIATACTFCGDKSEIEIAASFDHFVGIVLCGIGFDWNDPQNEGIMYDGQEGGYQAPLSETSDVFYDYDISDNDEVVQAVIDVVGTEAWVERDFYRGDDGKRLTSGWTWFKHVTMHQSRFLFLKNDGDKYDDGIPPSQMLNVIASVISKDLATFNFIKTICEDVDIYRIRISPTPFETAAAIGPPPLEFATQANRMSPAGIPMFYGAFDVDTAKAETFDAEHHAGQIMSIGAFRALRPLRLLDLAELPDIPSVFADETRQYIHPLRFLHAFAADLVKRIARDGREHIEYVPTQVVTEFFRREFRDSEGQPLDGLLYRSSRPGAGTACVLFAENDQCAEADFKGKPSKHLLWLRAVKHENCPPCRSEGSR